MKILTTNLGTTKYFETWELQKQIFELRKENLISDVLLFTEHENVYTLGKSADENHLLATETELKEKNIETFRIDRGGDITFHGPGQIVCYPIIDLNNHFQDVRRYLSSLEEVLILTLKDFGISATRNIGFTGVWVGSEKIAAMGVKLSKWVSMHGLALNVNTDLKYFDRIIPCGIFHQGVTSMEKILNHKINLNEVEEKIIENFCKVFKHESEKISKNELQEKLMVTHE